MLNLVHINLLLLCITTINSQGITITQSPDSETEQGSTQIISWTSPIKLDEITIDLYQNTLKTRVFYVSIPICDPLCKEIYFSL